MTHDDVMRAVQERDVKFIRLWFTDVLGRLKSFALPVEQLPQALAHGVRFDGSSITGFNPVEESDMVAVPDPATFAILPYRPQEQAVARLICNVHTLAGGAYEGDPRFVLRRAMDRARDMGFDGFEVATELEFFYFRDSTTPEPLDQGGYFDLTTLDVASDVRRATVLALEQIGIDVEFSHHESGPSQHEIDMRQADALQMADNVMTYRTIVKEIAHQHGWYATFMPKPLMDANGSGMHTHVAAHRRWPERVLRPRRAQPVVGGRPRLRRRYSAPRPRALLRLRPVGELLQAARARLRGPGVCRLERAQPLRGGARSPAGRGAGQHGRAARAARSRIPPATRTSPLRRSSTRAWRASPMATSSRTRWR